MIKAVLFDMDGILYDSEGFYMQGTINIMKDLGYTGSKEALLATVGTTIDGTCEVLAGLLDHRHTKEEVRIANDEYYEKHPLDYQACMFDGVKDVLQNLHTQGKLLACCSSSPMHTILESLEAMGIRQYFDFVESGEHVSQPKPSPEIYIKAMHALGVTADECIVYEDSSMGIEAGIASGARVVARRDERFKQDQSHATWIVNDVKEMEQVVQREDMR